MSTSCTSGTAGTAPFYWKMLQACGLKQTWSTGVSVTYNPWSAFTGPAASATATGNPGLSYSVGVWMEGELYALKGAMGNVALVGKAGDPLVWEFTFKGSFVSKTTDGTVPTIGTNTRPVVQYQGANIFALDSYNPVFESFRLDLGNVLSRVVSANDASGFRGYTITDRRPVLTLSPEETLVATYDFWDKWNDGTTIDVAQAIAPVGALAGSRFSFDVNFGQQNAAPKINVQDGRTLIDISLQATTTSTEGTELAFIFA